MFNHTVLQKLVNRFEKPRARCSSTPAIGGAILQLGDSGPLVHSLQITLADLNLYRGSLNGHFGPALAQALTQVQHHFDLPPTGKFDSATWYALSFWSDDLAHATPRTAATQQFTPSFSDSVSLAA